MPRNGKLVRITLALAAAAARRSRRGGHGRRGVRPRAAAAHVNGAGSTFVPPLVDAVGARPVQSALRATSCSYSGVGSGGGVAAITGKQVDFGASDAPLTQFDQFDAARRASRSPGRSRQRRSSTTSPASRSTCNMTGPVLAKIYMGKITQVGRPGDQEAQQGRRTCRARRSRSSTAPTARARRTTSPTTSRSVSATPGSRRSARGRPSNWPAGDGRAAAAPASLRPSRRRPARSATSTSTTPSTTTSSYFAMKNRSGKYVHAGAAGRSSRPRRARHRSPTTDGALSIVNPPEQEVPARVPDLDLHVRDRARSSRRRRPTSRSSSSGRSRRARPTGRSSSSSRSRSRCSYVRQEDDQEDPLVAREIASDRDLARVTTDATRRPFTGRRVRFGDLLLQVVAGIGRARRDRARRPDRLEGRSRARGSRSRRSGSASSGTSPGTRSTVRASAPAASSSGPRSPRSARSLIATPLAIGIALFLSELAPRWIRGPVTALVETLAAIPSVVIGLWGHPRPRARSCATTSSRRCTARSASSRSSAAGEHGSNIFTAIVVLTIMILPIVSSICRELFLGVPRELKEGALAPRHDALGDGARRRASRTRAAASRRR